MNAVDSSVGIAAFASWHELHELARHVVAASPHLPSHAAIEIYSVLTRLPEPFRVGAGRVTEWLDDTFGDRILALGAQELRSVPATLSAVGIAGGRAYDGLVGLLAKHAGAVLVSADVRAADTYRRLSVDFELISLQS